MVPQHPRARRRPPRALARGPRASPHPRRRLRPGRQRRLAGAYGTVVGVDRSDDALEFVRTRRPEILPARGDLRALPIASAVVDVVTAITVLHTVDDDAAAMRRARPRARSLRGAGRGGARLRVAAPHARRHRPRATALPARPTSRSSPSGPACRYGARRTPTRSWRRRRPPSALSTGCARAANHGTASDVERRSLDRVFAPLAASRAPPARPPRPALRHVGDRGGDRYPR